MTHLFDITIIFLKKNPSHTHLQPHPQTYNANRSELDKLKITI